MSILKDFTGKGDQPHLQAYETIEIRTTLQSNSKWGTSILIPAGNSNVASKKCSCDHMYGTNEVVSSTTTATLLLTASLVKIFNCQAANKILVFDNTYFKTLNTSCILT